MNETKADVLAFMSLPTSRGAKLHSNPIERLNWGGQLKSLGTPL
jgi:hypothetical protein